MPRLIIVQTSFSEEKEAQDIAKLLLTKKLAACCNITPEVKSIYTWKEKEEESKEYILEIKTRASHYSKIEKLIKKNHRYECPAIYAINIAKVSKSYAKWILESTEITRKRSTSF